MTKYKRVLLKLSGESIMGGKSYGNPKKVVNGEPAGALVY
jgi:uridylate kinase